MLVVVVVLGFYVPPTAKVIRRRDLGLKSHPNDWRRPGSNSRPLVYKASSLTTTPRRLLNIDACFFVNFQNNDQNIFLFKSQFHCIRLR